MQDAPTVDPEVVKRARESLSANKNKSEEAHDKALTTLTAGTLAVSVSFIGNVVHLEDARAICLLIISWVLLTVSLMINVIGHLITADHSLSVLEELDKDPTQYIALQTRGLKYNCRVRFWNRVCVGLSLLAISLIIIFCSINVYQNAI